MAQGSLEGYVEVIKLDELTSSGRARVTVKDRVLALFYVKGRVYALDHFCYRKALRKSASYSVVIFASSHLGAPQTRVWGLVQLLVVNFSRCAHLGVSLLPTQSSTFLSA